MNLITKINILVSFSPDEQDILKDLPNTEYLLNTEELHEVLTSLIDILFAYCYDKRTTDFESSCESGWNISKISATLSWFDVSIVRVMQLFILYPVLSSVSTFDVTKFLLFYKFLSSSKSFIFVMKENNKINCRCCRH